MCIFVGHCALQSRLSGIVLAQDMDPSRNRYQHYIIPLGVILAFILSACVFRRPQQGHTPTPTSQDSLSSSPVAPLAPSLDSLAPTPLDTLSLQARRDSLSLQDSLPTDSLPPRIDSLDRSTAADSIKQDPLLSGFDDIIEYKAKDSIVMLGSNLAYLFGPSTVDYKDKGLEANFMRMNVDSNLIYAHYVLDSLGKPMAHPKFKDGNENYEVKSVNYNFRTAKGFITGVVTQQGEGFVVAERTKKDSNDCMYMEGGRYTTCSNHEHPHFYLSLTKAKVRPGKNIVAGLSYLVIGDVPLPIFLPFGFFPFTSSYSSGIIMPKYGEEMNRGLYLREGGYYWAINDYVDLAVTGDWYSQGSWGVNARSNYRKRYRHSGGVNLSYIVTRTGDKDVLGDFSESKDFRISWTHSQDAKANPNQSFSASVNFSTSSYNHNSLNTLYNPLVSGQNTKSSSINYSRNFVGTPFRLSASIDASQTSSTQQVTMSLPNISLSMNRIFPFKRKKRVGRERWYEKIGISYSGQMRNTISTHEKELFKSNLIKDWKNGINHSIPISASYKLFDYIDLTLSASYNERWYSYKSIKSYNPDSARVVSNRVYGFNRAYDFSTSANLNTTVYGFFKPWRIFGDKLQMIRHRMTPSIGISYRPDFGDEFWGFYRKLEYIDKSGQRREEIYSLYQDNIFGSPGRGKSASLNFSLDNNIEAKIKSKQDTVETFKKVSLIDNFSLSTSYNMAADSFQLSDISARINLKLTQSFNLSLSGAFDPYVYGHTTDAQGNKTMRRLNKLRVLNGRGIGALRGTGTSFSYTFNNETFKKLAKLFSREADSPKDGAQGDGEQSTASNTTAPLSSKDTSMGQMAAQGKSPGGSLYGNDDDMQYDADGYGVFSIPWSLSVSYGVNLNQTTFDFDRDEYNYGLTHNLMLSGTLQPTKNWSFNFNASYDFERKRISNMTIGISRDLHCWNLTASAIPFGLYKSYNLTIGVKSSLLKDLKYDKHSRPVPETWY